jgi:hypothetical protein
MGTSISVHLDGRAVPDRFNSGTSCICHHGSRHGVTIALNELADDGNTRHGVHLTVWVDTPSLYVLARELERIADHCRGVHQRYATGEELSEALEGAVDDLLAGSEVAPREDTAATGHLGEEVA